MTDTRHETTPEVVEVDDLHLDDGQRRRRIVAGVDGSFGSACAVAWAAAHAREYGLVLDLVAVWEQLTPDNSSTGGGEEHLQVARDRLERAIEALSRQRALPERVISAPLRGAPGPRLVQRARDAQLLVLGTTGISSPEIPGGIGLYCLRHTTTPVVFVPTTPAPPE
jgi:nucleotide-binding universal stress UspA family protein